MAESVDKSQLQNGEHFTIRDMRKLDLKGWMRANGVAEVMHDAIRQD